MFIGAINADLRNMLATIGEAWKGLPLYIGCSGNFTIERIVSELRLATETHSNDISLYSCALGRYLQEQTLPVTVKAPDLHFLAPFLVPGVSSLATLLICTSMLEHWQRTEPYHRRMWNEHVRTFSVRHKVTCEKIETVLKDIRLTSFVAGDVVDFMRNAPRDAAVVTFPPTYKSGYERLYKKMEMAFSWEPPSYVVFDEARIKELIECMQSKASWTLSFDRTFEELDPFLVGSVKTSPRSHPVYVYSSERGAFRTVPPLRLEPVHIPRHEGAIQGPLRLVYLTRGEMATLRAEYLAKHIVPADAQMNLGVLTETGLVGCLSFSTMRQGDRLNKVYMMADFAIGGAQAVKRLSKLILMASLSKEVQALLQGAYCTRIKTIMTTAFTDKPESMKYRGIYAKVKQGKGFLNYEGQAGHWTLAEGLGVWKQKYNKTSVVSIDNLKH